MRQTEKGQGLKHLLGPMCARACIQVINDWQRESSYSLVV